MNNHTLQSLLDRAAASLLCLSLSFVIATQGVAAEIPAAIAPDGVAAVPFKVALDSAAILQSNQVDNIKKNALVIGNGDLNALVYSPQGGAVVLRVTKNDVWDARVDTSSDPAMIKLDVKNHTWTGGTKAPASWGKPYPQPRTVGLVQVGVDGVTGERGWTSTLDLRQASARFEKRSGNGSNIAVRALAEKNVFLILGDGPIKLTGIQSADLPAVERGEKDGVQWLKQVLPGDLDYRGMEFAMAAGTEGARHAVAVVTSWESRDVVGAAVKRVRETLGKKDDLLVSEHESMWANYWSASGVELGDKDFQNWWYRMLYYNRCFSKLGVVPVGLFAGLSSDNTPWHSSYKINYNIWQTFWPGFVCNHPELAEPWIKYMKDWLPRAQWLAKENYGCEGAYYFSDMFAFEPMNPAECKSNNGRQISYVPWGYTIGMSAMGAQNLWLDHLYRPDRKYLKTTIYPVIRDVALFYVSFMEKCARDANGKVRLGPSFSPEHGPFGTDNCPFDIAYVKGTLDAMISAAEELKCDKELSARCSAMREALPEYPTALNLDQGNQLMVVDWQGCKADEVKKHNITVPATPVFPVEQVTWFSPEPEKELFKRTIEWVGTRHNRNNANVMINVCRARMSMTADAINDTKTWFKGKENPNGMFAWLGHGEYLSESFAVAGLVSEFLLQSVGNIIRVFPAWPKEMDAKFVNLRAQGGFLVSAEQRDGKVVKLEIEPTVDGTLRLLSPWSGIKANGKTLAPDARGVVEMETKARKKVVLEPQIAG